jgi:hypothetical protein
MFVGGASTETAALPALPEMDGAGTAARTTVAAGPVLS